MGRRVKKHLPKWMNYYDKVAYIILFIDALYAIGYLIYIGHVMNDRKMYLPYNYSRSWLELNSYSLLPPFFAIPAAPMIMWQVKNRIDLSDGDFYGLVGSMLGLGATSLFDAYKTIHIYTKTSSKDFDRIREAMHNGVRGEIYTDYIYNITIRNEKNDSISLTYENKKDGLRVQDGDNFIFITTDNNRILPPNGTWNEPIIADKGIRFWTHSIQHDLDCCGSHNFTDWDEFDGDLYQDDETHKRREKFGPYPPSCYCKYSCSKDIVNHENCFDGCETSNSSKNLKTIKRRPGCHNPYMKMLRSIYLNTFILMLIMGILYIVTIFAFVINFAAVRLSREQPIEDDNLFSLLRSTSGEISMVDILQRRSNKYLHQTSKEANSKKIDVKKGIVKGKLGLRVKKTEDVGSKWKTTNKVTPLVTEKHVEEEKNQNHMEPPKPTLLEKKVGGEAVMVKVKSNKGNTNLSVEEQSGSPIQSDQPRHRVGSITGDAGAKKNPVKSVTHAPNK